MSEPIELPIHRVGICTDLHRLTPGGQGAPGGLFHWVAKTADGIRVTDVWESREQFERFSKEKIAPYSAEVGFPGQPRVTFFDIHNYLTKG